MMKPMFQGKFSKINLYQCGQIFPREIISGGSKMLRCDAPVWMQDLKDLSFLCHNQMQIQHTPYLFNHIN